MPKQAATANGSDSVGLLDVQRSQAASMSCHLRSPAPWVILFSLGAGQAK